MSQFAFNFGHELIVDLFAGGGGASEGIKQAFGRDPDIAVNHDAIAVQVHAANHPGAVHYRRDVFEVSPREVTNGRPVGLLWASPDCFPKGTLVLTRTGYRAIEQIRVGDQVLSHKGQWRAVTETSSAVRPIVTVRGHGHPALRVSPEHPFYLRRGKAANPEWMPISGAGRGSYWAAPCEFPNSAVPVVPGRGMAVDARLLWLAGRYVGDGWTRITKTRAELVITCGEKEAAALRLVLEQWPRAAKRAGGDELAWHERRTRTAVQFSTNHRGLVTWLRKHFGHRAENKAFPAWSFGIARELRTALVDGYLSADGYANTTFREATTVSKALAFSLKALANSLGHTVAIYTGENSSEIEGRKVNARPYWRLRWRHKVADGHRQTFVSGRHEWTPIREVSELGPSERVYNIGVDVDESYVVEGIVVHNCKHFSKAKGGKPVSKKIRGLAWVVVRWAKEARPRVIVLENVEEFVTWGPLVNDRPCPDRKGQTFRRWVADLRRLGYKVEHRELRACDYGAPTSRKRFFLIARCDGLPITWPKPTHGKGLLPYRTAADCIDFALPCPSIFLTREEGRAIGVKRPLAEATMRRIWKGVHRFVLNCAKPFIVRTAHGDVGQNGSRRWGAGEHDSRVPLPTVTGSNDYALAAPVLVPRYGERPTQEPRALPVDGPMPTVVPTGNGASLVSAFLTKYREGSVGVAGDQPFPTITANGESDRPGGNPPLALVSTFMEQANTDVVGHDMRTPVSTIVGKGCTQRVAAVHLSKLYGTSTGAAPDEPAPTVTAAGNHIAEVRAFLIAYYGNEKDGRDVRDPMGTIVSRERFGLVTVDGTDYEIADIGLRMLTPRELFRAQGFPERYVIDRGADGARLSKEAQVRLCGNSVCPPIARAIVSANCGRLIQHEREVAAA